MSPSTPSRRQVVRWRLGLASRSSVPRRSSNSHIGYGTSCLATQTKSAEYGHLYSFGPPGALEWIPRASVRWNSDDSSCIQPLASLAHLRKSLSSPSVAYVGWSAGSRWRSWPYCGWLASLSSFVADLRRRISAKSRGMSWRAAATKS